MPVPRFRHHTDAATLAIIRAEEVIIIGRSGGVDVETQPFGPSYRIENGVRWSASDDLGAARRGAYVELDLPPDVRIEVLPAQWFAGGRGGATLIPPEGAARINLVGLHPEFVVWWRWWHHFLTWKQR
jgi:hypothetical protein